jgi:hypothetical protein
MGEARVGQQYSKVDGTRLVWKVVAIETDLNGIRHCHIVDVNDRTNVKLISERTLSKRKFYRLLAEPVHSYAEVESPFTRRASPPALYVVKPPQ